MTMIRHALILFAIIDIVFSHGRIPDGYDCAWLNSGCPSGQISYARCNCDCPGYNLCCNLDIQDDYFYPLWHGSAPFCGGDCQKSCGGTSSSLCWWTSSCGNSAKCWTGRKVLCGYPWRRIRNPFINYVSSLLQWYWNFFDAKLTVRIATHDNN